ncbi:FtsK/SpoIIIE domain-containing protein [Nocardia cyriacigeorgica]|uniref:FtsK/SpoIIIE domain-containing protein n=1 Tax=Nocardia cyriacigeorgica TaxID=135487 RepID=UPI0024543B00|nr:FtsK/SpoIIIE domain-containing protein [Nocardia cyriacigeorgica]
MSAVAAVVAAAGAVGASGVMWYWSRLGAAPAEDVQARTTAEAPPELRAAVFVVTDSPQLSIMWPALGLGSWQTGFPNVVSAEYTTAGLAVEVQILGGQKLADWTNEDTLDAMAQYLGVPKVVATGIAPGFVRLELKVWDSLAEPSEVTRGVLIDEVDLEAVPVGVTEDGEEWRVPVQGRHILLGGGTGSGKSGVLQALVFALAPAIASGRVDLRVIDPKGGMEFGFLEDMCTRFECTMPESMIAMLEETVTDMQEQAAKYRGKVRKPIPTPENPLTVIIIDEAATLSAFTDSKLQDRFKRAHGLLLSQGRAPLFSVIETVIDPSKETVPQRQLFPYRIGMRMDEPTQVAMIHGQSARERGSRCDEIPTTTPGVCYVQEDGKAAVTRVRAYLVTDDDIDWMVHTYKPTPKPVVIDTDKPPQPPAGPAALTDDDDDFDPATFDPDFIPGEDDQDGPVAA